MAASFPSSFVPEIDDRFLALFPHRWDYIWATHPRPDESPAWQTESRYPLSDRQIQKGDKLLGVRFGRETRYFLLDIDRGSPYHPSRDPMALGRLTRSLEFLGLTDCITITSSYSGGLHVYFPLPEPVASWEIASVITHHMNQTGFLVQDGLLEVFPNVRNFDKDEVTLFKAHRLPLQPGSYLLDKSFNLTYSSPEDFDGQWAFCEWRNQINPVVFRRLLDEATRTHRKLGRRGEKFFTDLTTEIEAGWTAHGQTNYLLGRITLRSYVFGGWLEGSEPLTGERLVAEVVKVATGLPGYKEWCRHQHEIYQRAEEWARCAENSHYYPYKNPKGKRAPSAARASIITWNQFQQRRARERLCFAIADLLNRGTLPAGAGERCRVLCQGYQFSAETLYHHRDLWHPDHLWKTPPHPPELVTHRDGGCLEGAPPPDEARSLFAQTGGKPAQDKGLGAFLEWAKGVTGCNSAPGEGFSDSDPGEWWIDPGGGP